MEPRSLGPRGCCRLITDAPERMLFCDIDYKLRPSEISFGPADITAAISVVATGIPMRATEISYGSRDLMAEGAAGVII